jgi:peptide chain release factor 1
VSDHRINLTLYNLAKVMEGDGLDELIKALIADAGFTLVDVRGGVE